MYMFAVVDIYVGAVHMRPGEVLPAKTEERFLLRKVHKGPRVAAVCQANAQSFNGLPYVPKSGRPALPVMAKVPRLRWQ